MLSFVAGSLSLVRHKTLLFLMYELIVFEVTFIVMNPFAGFFDTSIAFLCGPLFALFAPRNQAGYRLCSFAFPVCIAFCMDGPSALLYANKKQASDW